MDVAAVGADAFAERVEVQGLERALGLQVLAVMGDEQLAVHEVDVGLDRAESVVQGVEQRTLVRVVVVRVGARERRSGGGRSVEDGRRQEQEDQPPTARSERSERVSRRLHHVCCSLHRCTLTPISARASPMAYTTCFMSASKSRPMLPMRKVSAWLIFPG